MKSRLKPVMHCLGLAFGSLAAIGVHPIAVAQQQQLERVEITGSMVRRVDAETALPVTIITSEELVKQGVQTAEQAMSRIAANQSNFGTSAAIGGTTGAKAEADLRGLSAASGTNANKTLVLLNGRRIANHAFDSAAVDLNAIPMAAISRIEVLRDGASAIYGTDAIAGVINFILRREYQGVAASYENQTPQESGGADINRVNVVGGFGSLAKEGFNIMGTLDWRKQKVLAAVERKFSRTGVLGPTRDDLTSGTSGTAFPGDLNGFEPTAPNCAPPASLPRFSNPDNTGTFETCRYDFTQDIDIIPENEQFTGLLRGSLALGANHTASLEYLYANNQATARVAPAPTSHYMPASSQYFPAGAPATLVPDQNNPGAYDENSPCGYTNCVSGGVANWRQVPAGKRTSGDDSTTTRLVADIQGFFGDGWDYRAALWQSKNKSNASVKGGYVNDAIMQEGVWNGAINPFGDQSAAGQAAIGAAQVYADTYVGEYKVSGIDARVTKDLMQLTAGTLSMAVGAEYRREKSSVEATDITAELPSLGIDPDADTSGSRNVTALFAEFAIPILKNLDGTVALRWDDYSDFGSTTNPKFSLRYQPVKQVLLRGSYNKGFRAPTLYEIYQPASLTYTSDNYDDPLLCPGGTPVPGASAGVVCGQQVLQQQGGPGGLGLPIDTLQPEKSDAWTVGVVFEPIQSITVGLDYWSIKTKNQISGLPEQAIFGDATKYAGRFVRCSEVSPEQRANITACLNYPSFDPIAYIETPTENLGDLKTSGVDLAFGWRSAATEYGSWGVMLDGTYITEYKYQREPGGEEFNAVGRYSDNAPVFRWQHVASVTWSMGSWSALFANRYKTGYLDQDAVSNVDSYSVYDLTGTWQGVKNLTVSAGVLNLFDEDPPKSVQVTTFQRGYDPRFTDPRGRTWYLRLAYKFL
ncbi:MAG: TonB-dependent receptor [Burkholderiales bacterium]|nr:MAG: TonB-dependent receptor [Burkholderiales bacterium]